MANSNDLQETLVSSREKKAASSPASVEVGAWVSRGETGAENNCNTAWAKEGGGVVRGPSCTLATTRGKGGQPAAGGR